MRNTIRNTGHKWILGLAMLGIAGSLGTASAHAAPVQFQAQYGAAYGENYVPPCPGEGYIWTAGYYNGGYWVPGAWVFQGGRGYRYGFRGYDRDHSYYEGHREFRRDFDRREDRDREDFRRGRNEYRGGGNDRHRDHDRGDDRGWRR